MTHTTQALTGNYCGQACLAMLAGVPLDVAIKAVGHRQKTTKKAILQAARRLGLRTATNLWTLPDSETEPHQAIMAVRRKYRRNWHWVAVIEDVIYDPLAPVSGHIANGQYVVCWMEFLTKPIPLPKVDNQTA